MRAISKTPGKTHYDVVIVGGAIMGSSVAWFLTENPDFDGSVLVVERDPGYLNCSTAHTNSCMRQQFSTAINIKVSQFAAEFVRNFQRYLGHDPRVPALSIQNFGYLYLADTEAAAQQLRDNQRVQAACGAGTRLLTPAQILDQYPFYQLDDIVLGSHNTVDEGYFDGTTLFEWWRRQARERGVEFIANEVQGMRLNPAGTRVEAVTLASGDTIGCATVVNASGPRAALTARMAGIELPVEPRKRYTFIFSAEQPLARDLPLTIDPSGVHVRSDGGLYMAGCTPEPDPAVAPDDFDQDHSLWQDKVWPVLAARIPSFAAIRLQHSWAGHYAYNTFDQNAVLGPHPVVGNFMFINGFSGHGLQQSPAMGRGLAELITHGRYRTLDMSAFSYARIVANDVLTERAVI